MAFISLSLARSSLSLSSRRSLSLSRSLSRSRARSRTITSSLPGRNRRVATHMAIHASTKRANKRGKETDVTAAAASTGWCHLAATFDPRHHLPLHPLFTSSRMLQRCSQLLLRPSQPSRPIDGSRQQRLIKAASPPTQAAEKPPPKRRKAH